MNEAQNKTNNAQGGAVRAKLPKWVKFIYYPLLIVAAIALVVVSFVTYYRVGASTASDVNVDRAYTQAEKLAETERNSATVSGDGTTADVAADLIKGYLDEMGITESVARKEKETNADGSEVNNKSVDQKITADLAGGATYTFMDMSALGFVPDRDTVDDMTKGSDEEGLIYARPVKNFVIAIPGSEPNADAIMLMTHYDSLTGSQGAASASAVSAMLGAVDALKNEKFTNDVIFLITDGRYEDSLGAYAYKNQFVGFNNVWSRTKAVINFDAITAGGALTVVRTTEGDNGIMAGYVASDASVRLDTAVADLLGGTYTSDLDAFYNATSEEWEVAGMELSFTAGAYDAGTRADSMVNVGKNGVGQYASAMQKLAEYFGNADLSKVSAGGSASAYTYLGGSFATSDVWVYAIAAMLIILLAVTVAFAVKKKAFGVQGMFKGVAAVLLTLALSVAAYFVAYFLIGLLTVAFGAATMNMLTMAHVLTPAILIPAMLFAGAVSCGLYPLFKRALKIKAADCVRGGALTQIITAIVFGFVVPTAALPYLIIGLINGAVMLCTTLLKEPFKKATGFGIERMFLYTLPTIFGAPLLIQPIMLIGNLFPIVTLPFLLVSFALTLSSITPYFDYLKPVMSDVYDKLPAHTIRVVETVTEEREDKVKRGKFESVTETKVLNKKVKWKYHNWFGVTVLCVLTSLILLIATPLASLAGNTPDRNITTAYDYKVTDNFDSIYDKGVVCVIDASYGDPSSFGWQIKDEWVYRNIRNLEGFDYYVWDWDEDAGMYKTAPDHTYQPTSKPSLSRDTITSSNGTYTISPVYGERSRVKLEITGVGTNDVLTVSDSADGAENDPDYSITFADPADTVTVVLPSGYADKYVRIVNSSGEASTGIRITAYEYVSSSSSADGVLNLGTELAAARSSIENYFTTKFNESITFTCVLITKS